MKEREKERRGKKKSELPRNLIKVKTIGAGKSSRSLKCRRRTLDRQGHCYQHSPPGLLLRYGLKSQQRSQQWKKLNDIIIN